MPLYIPLRATVRLRLDIAMQIRRAHMCRRLLAHSCTPWRHTSSKATPPLCPWRTFNKIYSPSVLGLCLPRSPCATTTRNCASPLRYRYANPPRPNVSSPARPQPHAVASHFKQSNNPPYVPGGLSTKSILPPFWVRVCHARRVPPPRATVRLRLDITKQSCRHTKLYGPVSH